MFGLGPSSALAQYLAIPLNRFGLEAGSLTHSGLLFADELHRIRKGDLVVMLAYGRVYGEVAALLEEVDRRQAVSLLLTDSLAGTLAHRVRLLLPVPRGHADLLSMHTATLGLIEALLVGIATRRPAEAVDSLNELNRLRGKLTNEAMKLPMAKEEG